MNETENIEQAEASHRAGDLPGAEKYYRIAIEQNAESVDAHYGLATALLQGERLDEAEVHFTLAAKLEPEAPDITYNHALCLIRLGEKERALDSLNRAYRYCDGDPQFLTPIASALLELKKPNEALGVLAELPAGSDQRALLSARAYGQLSDWVRAVSLLSELYKQLPDDKEVVNQLSIAAARLRDYPLAIESFEHYMKLVDPGPAEFLRLADLYLMARRLEEAETAISQALENDEPNGEAWALRARIDRLRGRYKEARTSAEKSLALLPFHGMMWGLLVELADEEAEKKVLSEMKTRMEIALQHPQASDYHKTLILYSLGNLSEKLEDYRSAANYWSQANERQRLQLEDEGKDYRSVTEEEKFAAIKASFATVFPTQEADDFRPVFIVGMPRSGTTLVERILGQIAGVENCGENEAMAFIASQYGFDVQRGRLPPPAEMSSDQWLELAERYKEKTPHQSNIVTDKMPHNAQYVGIILFCFPNAKVVQMRRDPVSVCWSIYQRSFPEGHNYACDFRTLAHFYRLTDELMNHWSSIADDRVLNLQYEELVNNPESEARKLVSFCELPWSDACLQFHKNIGASFTFSEMQVRDPINTSRIARWKQYGESIEPLVEALRAEGYEIN